MYLVHPFVNLFFTYGASSWFVVTIPNLFLMWLSFAVHSPPILL